MDLKISALTAASAAADANEIPINEAGTTKKLTVAKIKTLISTDFTTATQITSTIATGTSPFIVASTTLNSNLNADKLDGNHGSYFAPLTSIPEKATGAELTAGTDNLKMATAKALSDAGIKAVTPINNLLKNGNFINNSTNGYGSTPDDWTNSNANPVQGGFPTMTKAELIALLGIADGDIEGLWNLNEASGNATDLSSNAYHLTDTNTVTNDADGLMAGGARKFTSVNSEYLNNTSIANLNIAGNQTFFCYIKPSAITGIYRPLGRTTSAPANFANLVINGDGGATGLISMQIQGLTTNTIVNSDVKLEINKWYFIAGVYDQSNTLLKIWVNGIKKQLTASGNAPTDSTSFALGRAGGYNGDYYGGLIQNAGVLSVALTDSQVKKLFAATLYRGQKIRRATTDALITQALPEDLVERLRGKNVSIVARAYQTVASTMQVSIDDGTETASATNTTIDAWQNIGISKTISATATAITLKLKHSTSDGNTWFKEVAFYEGSTLVYVWYPSYDDISRFPRLLAMDIPAVLNGYSFEEKRFFAYTSTLTGQSAVAEANMLFSISGKICSANYSLDVTSNAATFTATLPVKCGIISGAPAEHHYPQGLTYDNNAFVSPTGNCRIAQASAPTILEFGKAPTAMGGYATSNRKITRGAISYEID